MASIIDYIEKFFTIKSSLDGLEARVERLVNKIEDHEKRIQSLENREELLQEKMANTAIKAVNEMNYKHFERL